MIYEQRHFGKYLIFGAMMCALTITNTVHGSLITYTWTEDDVQGGNAVSGTLVVQSSAQLNGEITAADIVSFGFQSPFSYFQLLGLDPTTLPDPISTSNAGFTGLNNTILSNTTVGTHLVLDTDVNYARVGGESWTVTGDGGSPLSGVGHWTLTGEASAVPEPSSSLLAVLMAACGFLTCRYHRKKHRGVDILRRSQAL